MTEISPQTNTSREQLDRIESASCELSEIGALNHAIRRAVEDIHGLVGPRGVNANGNLAAISGIATTLLSTQHTLIQSAEERLDLCVQDSPAPGSIMEPDDREIIRLLGAWRDSVAACMAEPGNGEGAEWEALVGRAEALVAEVMDIPAKGVEGLAIKSYLALRRELGTGKDEFRIDYDGGTMVDDGTVRKTIADAVRLSPSLKAMLASAAVEADAAEMMPA